MQATNTEQRPTLRQLKANLAAEQSAWSAADQAERKAGDAARNAQHQLTNTRQTAKSDAEGEVAIAAANKRADETRSRWGAAVDAELEARERCTAAAAAIEAHQDDTDRALEHVATLTARLESGRKPLATARTESDKRAAELEQARRVLQSLHDAMAAAQSAFDVDASKRDAFVAAKTAWENGRIDYERAGRIASEAAAAIAPLEQAQREARSALASERLSPGYITSRLATTLRHLVTARRALMQAWVAYRQASDEHQADREEYSAATGDGASVAVAAPEAFPALRDLCQYALAAEPDKATARTFEGAAEGYEPGQLEGLFSRAIALGWRELAGYL